MVDTPSIWKPQHQVNLTDIGNQQNPAVISIGGGRYLLAWTEATGGPIGTSPGSDIVGQIYDALGNPIGAEFQLNQSFFNNDENDVALAGRAGGGFVMVYVDDDGGLTNKIRIEHFDMDGNKIAGPPSTLASDAADNMDAPRIAVAADGSHLVVYERGQGGDVDIVGKFVNPDGSLGNEFLIFSDTENQFFPVVAALSNGNFVVAWEDEYTPGTNTFVGFRIITPGTPPGVSGTTLPGVLNSAFEQGDPAVAALSGGGFVIVYSDNASGDFDIRAAIYDNAGNVVKSAFTINNGLVGSQNEPAVAALPDGGFVVIWDDDAAGAGVLMGQRFDAAGNEVGAEFFAGSIGEEDDIAITVLDDGRFFVAFEQTDPPDDDIHGTIFDPREKTVKGTGEDDVLTAFANGGTVKGKGGDDALLGTGSSEKLIGGGGKDYLAGMDGNDDIKTGGKKDSIVFAFELDKNNNVDTVQDWRKSGNDKLLLLDDLFGAVGDTVNKEEFRFGSNAEDGSDHLIAKVKAFEKEVTLYYDEDGQGGAGKVKFAVLEYKGGLDLSYKDFKVIEGLDI